MNNIYTVRRLGRISDDFLTPDAWNSANILTKFIYPWETATPPPMKFRALHDNTSLHCLFEINDQDIQVYSDRNEKVEVIYGDRVEMFFRQDEMLTPYYCLEIDPLGRVYDYLAMHYRKFDPGWSWPGGGLQVATTRTTDGYTVSIIITWKSLKELGLLKNNRMEVGVFRGKCLKAYPSTEEMRWISWIKPHSTSPDFHIPSAFGFFHVE